MSMSMRASVIRLRRFHGRFGNRIGQYALARSAAMHFGAKLEAPPWAGEIVFSNTAVSQISAIYLPRLPFESVPVQANVEIDGYFQHQAAFGIMSRAFIQEIFSIRPLWLSLVPKPRRFFVAAHLRRGDYVHSTKYAVIERTCYEQAIKAAGYELSDVIWIDESRPRIVPGLPEQVKSFLPDFLTMVQADVLFRANSTFSLWAGHLGSALCYSPRIGMKSGLVDNISFEKGNHCALISLKQFPNAIHTDMILPP